MTISDEAVETAAKASYEQVRPRMGFPTGFDEAPDPIQCTYRDLARAALESAAPFIRAQALEDAKAAAWAAGYAAGMARAVARARAAGERGGE